LEATRPELHGVRIVAVFGFAEWTIDGAAIRWAGDTPSLAPCALRMASAPSSTLSSGDGLERIRGPSRRDGHCERGGLGVLGQLNNADGIVLAEGQPGMLELPA
jgi:hypothetical protein